MSLHVAVCFEYSALNGGENSFLAIVPKLWEHAIDLTLVAPGSGPLAERFRSLGIQISPWQSHQASKGHEVVKTRRVELLKAIRQRPPDLIHANSLSMSRLVGPVAADLEIPSVGHLRDILRLSAQAIRDLSCHRRLLAVSEATRCFHVGQGLPSERVHVLHNGVDPERFHPRPSTGYLHRELGIDPCAPLLGGIGQLSLRKGWDVALSAFESVSAEHPSVHFVIAGEQHSRKTETSEYVRGLYAAAEAPTLRGRIHFLGRRNDVPELLPELTALIHPARQEPLGRVLLEAAATGLPIVTTDVGGTRDIFLPTAHAALLVQPDAPHALAHEISRVLKFIRLRDDLGKAARRQIKQRFRLDACADALAKHYNHALNSRPGGKEATSSQQVSNS